MGMTTGNTGRNDEAVTRCRAMRERVQSVSRPARDTASSTDDVRFFYSKMLISGVWDIFLICAGPAHLHLGPVTAIGKAETLSQRNSLCSDSACRICQSSLVVGGPLDLDLARHTLGTAVCSSSTGLGDEGDNPPTGFATSHHGSGGE